MKPDFDKMSKPELRAYVLVHRDDLQALEALHDRRTPDSEAIWFHTPQSPEEDTQQCELFQRLIRNKESNPDNSAT